jgi:hypothetical protein
MILVGNGHTSRRAGWRTAELIAPGRAGASVEVASGAAGYPRPLQLILVQVAQRSQEAAMAQKRTVELQDDLDGGPADETVRFGVDGAEYEIDLSTKNAAAFRRKLAPFTGHAREAGRGQRRRPARTVASRDRSGSIRAWAKQAGVAVSARGRAPASVAEQYQAATTKGH